MKLRTHDDRMQAIEEAFDHATSISDIAMLVQLAAQLEREQGYAENSHALRQMQAVGGAN